MDIKRMYEMIENLTDYSKKMVDCGTSEDGKVDTMQLSALVDMIKDLSESMYHRVLTNSMLESDTEEIMDMFDRYGEDRRFYDHYRYKNGRFAPKGHGTYRKGYEEPPYYRMMPDMYKEHDASYWRDMDRKDGKMYYTEPTASTESRYDRAKRMYTETKDMHKSGTAEDKQAKMRSLEAYTKELAEDVTEMITDMSAEEKNLLRTKMQTLAQKIQ